MVPRQKARDAILALTIFGALLLMPPILPFFDRPLSLGGVPLIVIYVFGVWLALIVLAWVLARRVPMEKAPGAVPAPPEDAARSERPR